MHKASLIMLAGLVMLGVLLVSIGSFALRRTKITPLPIRVRVVAAVPLSSGETIVPNKLKLMSTDAAPPEAYPTVNAAVGSGRRHASRAISVNELVLPSALVEEGPTFGNSGSVRPSMRAVAVPLNEHSGLNHFLYTGNHVDVLLTEMSKDPNLSSIIPLAQNVRIISVESYIRAEHKNEGVEATIILEVTPLDAEKILLAQNLGTLTFDIRGDADLQRIFLPLLRGKDLSRQSPPLVLVQ